MKGTYVEHLSWQEAGEAIRCHPVVLLPVGARTKEHGPHLPLNNDWLMAEHLARALAERCMVLVLPTLQYGYYPAFVDYPGSVSVSAPVMRDTALAIGRAYHRHGAAALYVLNTGISTLAALQPAAETLENEGLCCEVMDLRQAWAAVYPQVVTQRAGTHADEAETSIMLHLSPEVVRMERAVADVHPPQQPGPFSRSPNPERGIYSETGSYGDPTRADADKGRRLVDAILEHAAAAIEALGRRAHRRAQTPDVH